MSGRSSVTARRSFIGSQSLRKLELDGRREVGVIVTDPAAAKKIAAVFEADWAASQPPVAPNGKQRTRRSLFWLPPLDDAGVDDRAEARDGVEVELVAVDFGDEKRVIGVEADAPSGRCCGRSRPSAVCRRIPMTKWTMPFCGFDPFVEMIVASEHDADAGLQEQRFEHRGQVGVRPVALAGRVERMVEVRDLPVARSSSRAPSRARPPAARSGSRSRGQRTGRPAVGALNV